MCIHIIHIIRIIHIIHIIRIIHIPHITNIYPDIYIYVCTRVLFSDVYEVLFHMHMNLFICHKHTKATRCMIVCIYIYTDVSILCVCVI